MAALPEVITQLASLDAGGRRLTESFDEMFLSKMWETRAEMAEAMSKLGEAFFIERSEAANDENYAEIWRELKALIGPIVADPPAPRLPPT